MFSETKAISAKGISILRCSEAPEACPVLQRCGRHRCRPWPHRCLAHQRLGLPGEMVKCPVDPLTTSAPFTCEKVRAFDVVLPESPEFSVEMFDGRQLPLENKSVDCALAWFA